VPLFSRNKGDPEDAPASGDPDSPLAPSAIQRSQPLTLELLDWLIHALTAVISTPQVRELGDRRAAASLRDALKLADHLYPYTQEAQRNAKVPVRDAGAVPGAVVDDEADQGAGVL
jgi:hypothetical protein